MLALSRRTSAGAIIMFLSIISMVTVLLSSISRINNLPDLDIQTNGILEEVTETSRVDVDEEKDASVAIVDLATSKNETEELNHGQDHDIYRDSSEYEPLGHHPHAGARYPDGRYGYVADVTAVRKRHFQMLEDWDKRLSKAHIGDGNLELDGNTFDSYLMRSTFEEEVYTYSCNNTPGQAWEGVEGFKLMQKIEIGGPPPQPPQPNSNLNSTNTTTTTSSHQDNSTHTKDANAVQRRRRLGTPNNGEQGMLEEEEGQPSNKPRILCVIYTYEPHHKTMLQAVVNTWAWKCDGFFAASTATNETLGAVDLPHLGEENYNNMWQKTRSIWGYIHDNYVNDFDYFWLGGDDFLLYVDNLRGILVDHTESNPANSNENGIPVYLGHQIPQAGGKYFCGGGPGYVLNQVAVKRLIAEVLPTCWPEKTSSAEDRFLSNCFQSIGILCGNTADAKGQQRFLGMDPNFSATYKGDRGYFKGVYEFWGKMNSGFKWGIDLASEQISGFHNLRYPAFMHRIQALQFPRTCPSNSVVGLFFRSTLTMNMTTPATT